MSLKIKAVKSFSWTAFELIFSQGTVFVVGIILARILSPKDFGIIGIITAFVAIANSIVEGGFSSALLRKTNANNKDYNTVFYTNLVISVLLYLIILIFSDKLAVYFDIPILSKILIFSGIILIINALAIIQQTLLSKFLNFKIQAIISIIASMISGTIAVTMAYLNYGVWSLVALSILKPLINTILLWYFNTWRPALLFSRQSFNELFDYGYKLLVANLINTIYKNIYYVLIGKFFSTASLGYYTRAEQFQSPVSGNITRAIGKISFPMLSDLQTDNIKLKMAFTKFLRFSIFLNFTIMLAIAAMAKPLILLLIGEKWTTSIVYLQLLCVPGMLYPLQILHLNLLLVTGHSNLNLKLEVIKKIILLPLIYITVLIGIKAMIYGLILFAVIEYFINSYYTKKLINYSVKDQLKDIFPFILISFLTFITMYLITLLSLSLLTMLVIQIVLGVIVFVAINELLNLNEYIEIKTTFMKMLKR